MSQDNKEFESIEKTKQAIEKAQLAIMDAIREIANLPILDDNASIYKAIDYIGDALQGLSYAKGCVSNSNTPVVKGDD